MMNKASLIEFLREDVAPALGCTEPVCVALCAANAARQLTAPVQKIEVIVNPNIYKNGMSAGIPNFDKVGLEYAAALGAALRNPEKSLELLEDVTEEIRRNAEAMTYDDLLSRLKNIITALNHTIEYEHHIRTPDS